LRTQIRAGRLISPENQLQLTDMQVIALTGNTKVEAGKKAAKAIRDAGMIPAVMYGGGANYTFTTTEPDVRHLIYTPEFKVAEITLDGKVHRCIVKAIQFHPVSEKILHIDFQEMVSGKPLLVEVPVVFKGVSPGMKAGGKLVQSMRRVKIKATPEALVDNLVLDISSLELGQAIRVRDLTVPGGVEIMVNPSVPVAIIEIPRALRAAAAAAALAASKAKK
jgi:large subunit ribosomal protein L25